MAIDFPTSVANGYIYTDTTSGSRFQYYSSPGVWKNITYTGGYSKISVSSTAPSSPAVGDFWFYQDSGELYVYYDDGTSTQWVTATGGGGINNANNALTANNASYLGGLAAANYVNTSTLSSTLSSYLTTSGASFTGNVSVSANVSVTGNLYVTGISSLTGYATIANSLSVTGNVTFSNTLAVTGTTTFSSPVTFPASQSYSGISVTVGNSSISNTTILVGNSTVNAYINSSSIVVANSTGSTTLLPGSLSASNTTLSGITSISSIFETVTANTTAISGTINVDIISTPTIYFTSSSSGNWIVNVRGNSATSLNSILANNQSISVTLLVTQGATAYYPTSFSIDGTTTTVKWLGGFSPSSGDANSIDLYSYAIIKTGSATYSVLGSYNKYA